MAAATNQVLVYRALTNHQSVLRESTNQESVLRLSTNHGSPVHQERDPVSCGHGGHKPRHVVAEGVGVAEEEDAVTCYLTLNTAETAH